MREREIKIKDLGVIMTVANLIMCKLTGGLWLFVMFFTCRWLRYIVYALLNFEMVILTDGWWILIVLVYYLIKYRIHKDEEYAKRWQKRWKAIRERS